MGSVQLSPEPIKPAEQVCSASEDQSHQNDSTKGAMTSQTMQYQSGRIAHLVQ